MSLWSLIPSRLESFLEVLTHNLEENRVAFAWTTNLHDEMPSLLDMMSCTITIPCEQGFHVYTVHFSQCLSHWWYSITVSGYSTECELQLTCISLLLCYVLFASLITVGQIHILYQPGAVRRLYYHLAVCNFWSGPSLGVKEWRNLVQILPLCFRVKWKGGSIQQASFLVSMLIVNYTEQSDAIKAQRLWKHDFILSEKDFSILLVARKIS